MSFLFPQKRPKSINEVVYALNEWIVRVGDSSNTSNSRNFGSSHHTKHNTKSSTDDNRLLTDQQRQAAEESGRLLAQIRRFINVRDNNEDGVPKEPEVDLLTAMAKEVYSTDVLIPLVVNLRALDFEARRDVACMFTMLMQRPPTIEYLLYKIPEIFTILMRSAGEPEIHRTVCQMLRECSRHEALVTHIMNSQSFWWFFQYMDHPEFEVATDNFSTFQEFLRNYPELSTQFLLRNADYFTQCLNGLIRSNNYVSKRQTLRMLFQMLKQQRNHQFLVVYVNDLENLKLIMRLLKDKSKNINFEAFQIFKIIVANPKKPAPILEVLTRNKSKLLDMLDKEHILSDRREDQVYQKERDYVRRKIMALPDPAPRNAPQSLPETAPGSGQVLPNEVPNQASSQLAATTQGLAAATPAPSGNHNAALNQRHGQNQVPNPPYHPQVGQSQPSLPPYHTNPIGVAPDHQQSAPAHFAPRLVPQPATHLQPQLTTPQLVHRPASPSRAQIPPDFHELHRRPAA